MSIRTSDLLGREQPLGERLHQLGLADAGRAEEQERAQRAVALGQADAGAPDRVRHGLHGLVLADHALVQVGLELLQALELVRHQLAQRDAGARRDHGGDLGLADLVGAVGAELVGQPRSRPSISLLMRPASS